jgi:hypothetical protein
VYTLYFGEARRNIGLNLSWLAFGGGALFTYLAIEPRDWQSGNFTWSGEITLLVLFILSTAFFFRQVVAGHQRRRWALVVCATVLALHLLSGLIWYLGQLKDPLYTWW